MFSRYGRILTLVLFFLAGPIFCGTAAAAGFSADVFSHHGKDTMQGKMYFGQEKIRFETSGMITITRMDKKLVWLLMPTEKMYMEQPIRLENVVAGAEKVPGEVERTFLGQETVNGYAANKYRITIQSEGKRQSILQWLTVDGNLPVKTAAADGRWWQEFRNISLGEPDASLFEIPEGYKKFAMGM